MVAHSTNAIYPIDFDTHRITRLPLSETDGEALIATTLFSKYHYPEVSGYAIETSTSFLVLKPDGSTNVKLPLELGDAQGILYFGTTTDGRTVVTVRRYVGYKPLPDVVIESDSMGKLARRTELPLLYSGELTWGNPSEQFVWIAGGPLAYSYARPWLLGRPPINSSRILIEMGFLSALAAAAACCLCRRNAMSPTATILWTCLALLLGPAAVLLFLSMTERAARIPCPGCGRKRAAGNPSCEHCQAAFAPPKMTGVEVFEPAASLWHATTKVPYN
jgi:hypothetical protein